MADPFIALDAQIERLRSLDGMVQSAAPAIAVAARDEVVSLVRDGKSPDGTTLALTKKGEQPLRNAAAAITSRAIGDVVLMRLTGPEVLHHLGAARGGVKRPLIPTATVPGPMAKAIDRVLTDEFSDRMEGRRG